MLSNQELINLVQELIKVQGQIRDVIVKSPLIIKSEDNLEPFELSLERLDKAIDRHYNCYRIGTEICLEPGYIRVINDAVAFLQSEIRFFSPTHPIKETVKNAMTQYLKEHLYLKPHVLWCLIQVFQDVSREFKIDQYTIDHLRNLCDLKEYDEEEEVIDEDECIALESSDYEF